MPLPNCPRCKHQTFVSMPGRVDGGDLIMCGSCGCVVGLVPDSDRLRELVERLEKKLDAVGANGRK